MNIIDFNIPTLIGLFFWSDLTCVVLVYAYVYFHKHARRDDENSAPCREGGVVLGA